MRNDRLAKHSEETEAFESHEAFLVLFIDPCKQVKPYGTLQEVPCKLAGVDTDLHHLIQI